MEKQKLSNSQNPESPQRLRVLSRLHSEMHVKPPVVLGREHLLGLPKDMGVVIVPTHLSDIDIETAIADVSKDRQVGVAAESTNLKWERLGPISKFLLKGNLFEISGRFDQKSGMAVYEFNPDNFIKMKEAMAGGTDIIFAAHVPSYNWQLPDSSGIGAVFLAQQMEEPIVLPVAVDIDNKPNNINARIVNDVLGVARRLLTRKRPASKLIYGEAIYFEKIDNESLSLLSQLFNSEERKGLTKEQKLKAQDALRILKAQGEVLMYSMASILPAEKRGKWGKPLLDK